MTDKVKLAIFCPSTFDNYEFLCGILDKKVDEIGLIISNNSGHKLAERYAYEKNIPVLSYPVGKNMNILKANDLMIKASGSVLILDNGKSDNNKVVRKRCMGANKSYKIIEVPEEFNCELICDGLREIWNVYREVDENISFPDWLGKNKRITNKLVKALEEL